MKKILNVLLVMVFLFAGWGFEVQAEETITQEGIEVQIWTDEEEYDSEEEIEVGISVANHNTYAVEDVSVHTILPAGLEKESKKTVLDADGIVIEPGEEYILEGTLCLEETSDDTAEEENQKDWINIAIAVLGGAIGITLVALILISIFSRKNRNRMIGLLLCTGLLSGMWSNTVQATADESAEISVSKEIVVDDEEYLIKAEVSYSVTEEQVCTIVFNTNGGSEIENQILNNGELIQDPGMPIKEGFLFLGWYGDADCVDEFDFKQPVKRSCTVYARWLDIADMTDSDGDGLTDALEKFFGSNPQMADSDGDGLNDYVEVAVLNYNPLAPDTNENGVLDGDEDGDGDGLCNIYEVDAGTNPANTDSDSDGLDDGTEVNTWNTSPLLADTDNDGAGDKWETEHGFSPLEYHSTFVTEVKANQSVAEVGVVASVSMEGTGAQAETLQVKAISESEEPLMSSAIPGYMGVGYEISVAGKDLNATLTFEYDTSLGAISDTFQPRIYVLNEDNGTLQELENQEVVNGRVSAYIGRASKCILLNKTEFDKIWEQDIKRPLSAGEAGDDVTLDIMFVIDYSASMLDNDPNQLFKQVSEEFIHKLRPEMDKAGAVEFIREAYMVSELSYDKESVIAAIRNITYDDGYNWDSGTDGSAGIYLGLEKLEASDAEYQFIVFITDGEDNGYAVPYEDLIEMAVQNSVTIYTIGMGSANEALLTYIAECTGGKYYHATTGVSMDDMTNLDDVYGEIEAETVDLTVDVNADKIPDYYNELIKQGILTLSNGSTQFSGIDFNYNEDGQSGNDYDGDGLLNGEELVITQEGTVVYMQMKSNPLENDSDKDGYNDKEDEKPLVWDVSYRDLTLLSHAVYENYGAGTILSEKGKTLKSNNEEVTGSLSELDGWEVLMSVYNPYTGFEASAYAKDNNLVLATRGSEAHDLADIVQDWVIADFVGFLIGMNAQLPAMETFVAEVVEQYGDEYDNIYVTGHSLGGYLALMASSQLVEHDVEDKIREVVTFNGLGMNLGGSLVGTILDLDDYSNFGKIQGKLKHYRTDNDVVSLIGYTPGDDITVSRSGSIGALNAADGHGLFSFAERFSNENRKPEYDGIDSHGLRDEY